jgi:50S ribosomal protein L16 3-hydroxylase
MFMRRFYCYSPPYSSFYDGIFMKTGLGVLVHPHSLSEFMDVYSQNRPLVVHNQSELLTFLTDLPFLGSLENLLNCWPFEVQAHLPDLRDEASALDISCKDARKLFDNGMGLLFNEVQTISPLLSEWLQCIRKDLGLSAMTIGRCLVYATPDGKGTAAHFDQNINFVVQLHGTKIWRMAPNNQVQNPLTRATMGQPSDPELMSYIDSPLPDKLPETAARFELKPGSVLFVPRGYWHGTEAEGDALALNFTFTAPSWLDIFTAAVRSRLALSPEWRATADGVGSEEGYFEALSSFDSLISTFSEELVHWQASDILEATESEARHIV